MRKSRFVKTAGSLVVIMLIVLASAGQQHLPGHGNRTNRSFEEAVVSHVQATLAKGEKVELGSRFLCKDYKENGELRFACNVTYCVVSEHGVKEMHTAHVVCNGDKDRIIEWKEIEKQ